MPLYDLRCAHCDGIFEQLRPIEEKDLDTECPYCNKVTPAQPMMTGGRVALNMVKKWRPSSKVEELTGKETKGPGTDPKAHRTSILHTCKGFNCSICKT